jgi:hypothetical protein
MEQLGSYDQKLSLDFNLVVLLIDYIVYKEIIQKNVLVILLTLVLLKTMLQLLLIVSFIGEF